MSVTPDFVGQRYKDTNTGNIWRANSTTPGDWTLEVQNMEMRWSPTSRRLARLIGYNGFLSDVPAYAGVTEVNFDFTTSNQGLEISGDDGTDPSVTSIRFNNLASITDGGYLQVNGFTVLTTLYLDALVSSGGIFIYDNPLLTSLQMLQLVTSSYKISITSNTGITSVSFPSLVSVASDVIFTGCSSLQTVSLPNFLPTNGKTFGAGQCALDAASVNHILARAVANPAYVSGIVSTNGGTSAAPTGQGVTDKGILIGRGVNVATN